MPSDNHLSARAAAAGALVDRVIHDPRFQTLTDAAAAELGVRHAQISMVTDHVIAAAGPPGDVRGMQVELDQSLCATVLRTDERLISDDASLDPRLASIGAVADGTVRSYVGAPIRIGPDGHMVGVFCAYNDATTHWTPQQVKILEEYAAKTVSALENL
jgi:GAF domain-containing protein